MSRRHLKYLELQLGDKDKWATWIDASQCFCACSWSPIFTKASAIVSSAYTFPYIGKNTTYVHCKCKMNLDMKLEERQVTENLTWARALLYGCLSFLSCFRDCSASRITVLSSNVISFNLWNAIAITISGMKTHTLQMQPNLIFSQAILKNIPIGLWCFPVWFSCSRCHINMRSTIYAASRIYIQTDITISEKRSSNFLHILTNLGYILTKMKPSMMHA